MMAFTESQEVRSGTEPGFYLKKVGTRGEMTAVSRSGFSTNVFIVATSQWEQD